MSKIDELNALRPENVNKALERKYQKLHKLILSGDNAALQEHIDSGLCWRLEGSFGRAASQALEDGACILSNSFQSDYYGNVVPAWWAVKHTSKGGIDNAAAFYALEVA